MNDDKLVRLADVLDAIEAARVDDHITLWVADFVSGAVRALPAAAPRPMGEAPRDGTDFLSVAENMADAIEQAMPRIRNMWESFPYAELDGDDECMYRLRRSAEAWRNFQLSMQYAHPAAPEDTP